MWFRLVIVLLWGVLCPLPGALAASLEPPSARDALVPVPEPLREPAIALGAPLAASLRARDWPAALAGLRSFDKGRLTGPARADLAFLEAWAALRASRGGEALALRGIVPDAPTPPAAYKHLVMAELHRAAGDLDAALREIAQVDDGALITPRAWVVHAEILQDLGRTKEAGAVYERMIARPDPSDGNDVALMALATRRGLGSDAAYPLLRRLWANYPASSEGRAAAAALEDRYEQAPTWQEVALRAERLMDAGRLDEAIEVGMGVSAHLLDRSEEGCRLAYTLGRSHYKRNRLTKALEVFGDVGARCAGIPDGSGEKSQYLVGTALFRKGSYAEAAAAFTLLADRYGDTSYADDGLTQAGFAWTEADRPDEAIKAWLDAMARFPDGDTVPEAMFRVAFARYEAGDVAGAIEMADRLGRLSQEADEVHVLAGRYWAARWSAWPDVAHPNQLSGDAARKAQAVEGFARLALDVPYNYYAALAVARLGVLDPARAKALAVRPAPTDGFGPWQVRATLLAEPAVREAVALVRLGLVPEGVASWERLDQDRLRPDEMAWFIELRVAAHDWLFAHDAFHRWLRRHPPGTLGPLQAQIVRLAYPDRYWTEVQDATASLPLEARLFHALVREESLFNREVVSFAKAYGLSQLLPTTAREVAARLGMRIQDRDLFDPRINTKLGANYFDGVLSRVERNPCLGMVAYNAGPRRVTDWVTAHGNLPLDEFVERIPFRETRGYVKRVTSTWQVMRYAFDRDAPAFVDLSPWQEAVLPKQARP